jgi:Calcineurin-like phosphoesterase
VTRSVQRSLNLFSITRVIRYRILSVEDLKYASRGVQYSDLVQSLERVVEVMHTERKIGLLGGEVKESFVELALPKRLAIVGDLHGDLASLRNILMGINFETFLGNPDNKLVFLGDYVDRGVNSVGVIFIITRLKMMYPNSVILMRGNHEAPIEFPFPSHDLPVEVVRRYGYERGKVIYNGKILPFFSLLTLATMIDGALFLVHGGVPTENLDNDFREAISTADHTFLSNSIMEEILWNDPRTDIRSEEAWEYSRRGIGKHFGVKISRRWLEISGTKVIVRGHEPCQGYRIDHGGSVMTLFSCKEPYPKFRASYLLVDDHDLDSLNDAITLAEGVKRI